MKYLLLVILSAGFIALNSSCEKQEDKEQLILQERKAEVSNHCQLEENATLLFYLPIDKDQESIQEIVVSLLDLLIQGKNYLKINRDENAGEILISIINFSKEFPYDLPLNSKTLYESTNKNTALLAGTIAQMNYQCLPVVCFEYDGVFVVEDCC